MAPSSNYTLIALLVAFAVVAPSLLHQSAAARDGGAAKAAAAPAPSANGEVVLHPTASYEIPDLPLPRIIPCPPLFPKIPFIPCYNVTPPAPPPPPRPKECRTTLVKSLLPAPVNHTRALALVQACLDGVNPQPFSDICNNDQSISKSYSYFQETN
jgi:hypothetical protein